MPAASRLIAFAAAALALAGCHKQAPPAQNIVIDNGIDANAEIEVLPPDESSTTPSNQLENGIDNPDVNSTVTNSD